jgi:hypothetical protein
MRKFSAMLYNHDHSGLLIVSQSQARLWVSSWLSVKVLPIIAMRRLSTAHQDVSISASEDIRYCPPPPPPTHPPTRTHSRRGPPARPPNPPCPASSARSKLGRRKMLDQADDAYTPTGWCTIHNYEHAQRQHGDVFCSYFVGSLQIKSRVADRRRFSCLQVTATLTNNS